MIASDPDLARIETVRSSLPEGGLFHEKTWRLTPRPLPISPAFADELEKLGHRLTLFVRACNQLYRLSAEGRQPAWIAALLDRGKPPELVELSRSRALANEVPRVIRPDIVLTETGYTIAELDSVPGGIGLTAWLSGCYSGLGDDILGGASGMMDGFRDIFPGGDILVSREAATYLPEMRWLAGRLNAAAGEEKWRVVEAENAAVDGAAVYRFFELFDLPNIPGADGLVRRASEGALAMTPPPKPALEEKLWFALFWLRPLETFWRRAIGDRAMRALREVIPYTWLLDPSPLPVHAVIPGLGVNDWSEVGEFSQKERDIIVKISGFSDQAWGSRGVVLGQDLSHADWRAAIGDGLGQFDHHPHIAQRFHRGRVIVHPYWDEKTGAIIEMKSRVRLCPYYFVGGEKTACGGALATICPADKKLLHGMSEAILCPVSISSIGG